MRNKEDSQSGCESCVRVLYGGKNSVHAHARWQMSQKVRKTTSCSLKRSRSGPSPQRLNFSPRQATPAGPRGREAEQVRGRQGLWYIYIYISRWRVPLSADGLKNYSSGTHALMRRLYLVQLTRFSSEIHGEELEIKPSTTVVNDDGDSRVSQPVETSQLLMSRLHLELYLKGVGLFCHKKTLIWEITGTPNISWNRH